MPLYIKAIHIIFVVTWFAGLFYMPRLFIYNTEAGEKSPEAATVLREQFTIMMKRLWYGITWPSAILTLIFGLWTLWSGGWYRHFAEHHWLHIKLGFVFLLYIYHFSLQKILNRQVAGIFTYSSQQLRIWNEVATIFLIAIVMLATVKQNMSAVWGIAGLVVFVIVLMSAIRIYKLVRNRKN
ncbi:MAG: CopD family protein [Ferruginibacter sp.]